MIIDGINKGICILLNAEKLPSGTLERDIMILLHGIHSVEVLYTDIGIRCKELIPAHSEGTNVAVGDRNEGRTGNFRGTRTGKHTYTVLFMVKKETIFWSLLTGASHY